MDVDRVRSYLQVACAGLGFDIGEVWWMSNDSGTSTVAAIEEKPHESDDSSLEDAYADLTRPRGAQIGKKKPPKKRFLQLYTSRAYTNERSKLVQPHDNEESTSSANPGSGSTTGSPTGRKRSGSINLRRSSSAATLELDEEHVLSPRIVEAVTHSTQVVWANCQKNEGLLGRSDMKLQTAIGMPVGVDETGNVWVVVMFSPKNMESTTDAIDYLQYISKSAASTSIPCLLPVVGEADPMPGALENGTSGGTKLLTNGDGDNSEEDKKEPQPLHHSHSLVSIKPKKKHPDHTEDIGDGITAKFVSFNLDDGEEEEKPPSSPGGRAKAHRRASANELRNAPKDDWGIPLLPSMVDNGPPMPNELIDGAIADAFDEASYGVWTTVMQSAGGEAICTSESIASRIPLIRERLEEFATAFLGMSVFDVADAWTISSDSPDGSAATGDRVLKCLFTVSATETNPGINALKETSGRASVRVGDGAVGRAYSSGYPVWSSVKDLIYDSARKDVLDKCKIETAFAVPIFSAGDSSPSCVLSCYSLLPAESVPFVLNFVQKAVRLLWGGLDRVQNPHKSVGKELWKDVGPADLGEMAADVEMQKAFIGKKRPISHLNSFQDQTDVRDRSASLATQFRVLPNLAPASAASEFIDGIPASAPPAKGMAPAPMLPNTVQARPSDAQQQFTPDTQQFVYLDSGNDGHWAVQQAVQSVGDTVQPWVAENAGTDQYNAFAPVPEQQQQQNLQPPPTTMYQQQQQYQPQPQTQQQAHPPQFQMAYVNYGPSSDVAQQPTQANVSMAYPPSGVHVDDPATIQANLMEINALAQMHQPTMAPLAPAPASVPPMAQNVAANAVPNGYGLNVQNHVVQNQQPVGAVGGNGINVDQMTIIPLSQAEGSVILTGPSQNIYCTSNAQPVVGAGNAFDPNMFVDKKPCRIEGCNGFAVAKRPYCARHCGNRVCEREGCTKCAQGATRFCIAHGGGRRCTFPGCDKGARDKYFCAAHGGGKRCKREGCVKSAVGGSHFCTGHGGGKRCQVPGCDKSAQSSTKFCVKHGGGKKCQHQGCEKVARGRTLYCAAHGGGVRCKLEGCNRVAVGKAQLCRAHGGGANSRFNAMNVNYNAAAL
ncbi:hypothetical protein ACHAXT_009821 [Thalassiosira profunda]